jgi:hypothetical protein
MASRQERIAVRKGLAFLVQSTLGNLKAQLKAKQVLV